MTGSARLLTSVGISAESGSKIVILDSRSAVGGGGGWLVPAGWVGLAAGVLLEEADGPLDTGIVFRKLAEVGHVFIVPTSACFSTRFLRSGSLLDD